MNLIGLKETLEESKPYMEQTFHVKEIGIFGSSVKSSNTAKSDVDILIDFQRGHKDFFNFMRLKYYLENLLGKKVDLVMKNAIKPILKKSILSEVEYV
ncbi:MAG: nucleotidyltransferase family protein [Nitrospirota bacterium]